MRLTDFFKADRGPADAQKAVPQADSAAVSQAGRRVRGMVPGQTIQGEVVARSGSEVQIKISDDVVVSARLERNLNIEVGQSMMFQVRSHGPSLLLSPLFANMATDANAFKALEMASLPVNDATVELTRQLMGAGQPIDRSSLQQAFREFMAFPDAEILDMIDLHKLSLPVTRENLEQLASYKNMTHQLAGGMGEVLDALPAMLQDMAQKGNVEGAARLYGQLLAMAAQDDPAGEAAAGKPGAEAAPLGEAVAGKPGAEAAPLGEAVAGKPGAEAAPFGDAAAGKSGAEAVSLGEAAAGKPGADTALAGEAASGRPDIALQDGMPDAAQSRTGGDLSRGGALAGTLPSAEQNVFDFLEDAQTAERMDLLAKELSALSGKELPAGMSASELLSLARQLLQKGVLEHDAKLLKGLLGSRNLQDLARDVLHKNWTVRPEEVAEPKRVEALYERLSRQLKGITQALENAGQTSSEAFKACANLGRNLDFLQQINQMYAYVQLPLRLQQGDAHGELYVYANKKSLASKEGAVSALLHLDMDHLGTVDVYVSMQSSKVSTQFYVSDSEILDFLEERMDLLTERLQKRGYDCSCRMQTRDGKENEAGNGKGKGFIQNLLAGGGGVKLAQYAFDVRA